MTIAPNGERLLKKIRNGETMKRNTFAQNQSCFPRVLSTLLVLSLLAAGCSGLAFAEVRINNQIKGSEGDTVVIGSADSQQRGLDLVLSTGDQNTIDMPNIHAYIQPAQMYVDAPGDHSIYVYQGLKLDKKRLMPFAYEGQRVTAVAEQTAGDTALTCIVYRDENYRLHAGWVHRKYLTAWFPGAVAATGSSYLGTKYTAADPVLSWAGDYFVGTRQKYTVLTEPVRACTQFSLNYQVTGRGGAKIEEILGTRTVYVNDGSGWSMAGSFDYPKIQSVLVSVSLSEPTDLLAVAVIPSCRKPDVFTFRQSVQDVLSSEPATQSYTTQQSETPSVTWNTSPDTVVVTEPASRSVRKGSIVTYGIWEQDPAKGSKEPVEWIVLDVQEDRLLLISRYGLDCLSYCSSKDTVSWETSRIRAWLNDRFLESAFTSEEQAGILVTQVDNSKNQGYVHYEGDGGPDTEDRLFLLSYAEAWKYFPQNSDRACKPTKAAVKRGAFKSSTSGNCPWWLRSPGYMENYVAAVDVDGNRGGNVKYGAMAVRSAMWISRNALQGYGTVFYQR